MPYTQSDGAALYYEDHGEGQPIVFLHGVMCSLRFFEPELAGLSNEYRPIAFDFRGYGRSEKMELGHTRLPDRHPRNIVATETQCTPDRTAAVRSVCK